MKDWCMTHPWMVFFILMGFIDGAENIIAALTKTKKTPMIYIGLKDKEDKEEDE